MPSDFDQVATVDEGLVQTQSATNETLDESDVTFHYFLYNVIAPTVFSLIIVAGVVDNTCVVAVVALQSKMRTAVNLLLLNLAIGDLAFLTTGVPFVAYHHAADNWRIADVICPLSHYVLDVTGYVTVYTLVTIAAVRFLKLVHHESDLARGINNSVMVVVIGGLWAAALATNWPVLWFYRLKDYHTPPSLGPNPTSGSALALSGSGSGVEGAEAGGGGGGEEGGLAYAVATYRYCGVESVDIGRRLFVVFFLLAYVLPLVVTCALYCLILRHLQRRWRESSIHRPSGSSLFSTATGPLSRQPSMSREHHWRAARLLGVVVIVFAVSRLPLHVQLLLSYVRPRPLTRVDEVFRLICHCLAYSNSLMNPLIYSFVSVEFRHSFRQLLCCQCSIRSTRRSSSSRRSNDDPAVRHSVRLRILSIFRGQGQGHVKAADDEPANQMIAINAHAVIAENTEEDVFIK